MKLRFFSEGDQRPASEQAGRGAALAPSPPRLLWLQLRAPLCGGLARPPGFKARLPRSGRESDTSLPSGDQARLPDVVILLVTESRGLSVCAAFSTY